MDKETNTDSDRKLASIQIVGSIDEHTNATSLELATILGWQVVTRINEAKVGDLVVYCEIDSVLPNAEWVPPAITDKISKSKKDMFRLKTIKLRGEYSQGLIVPLVAGMPFDITEITEDDIGKDVTDLLGIVKYEPPALSGAYGMYQTNSRKTFPSHLLDKTDETRVQSAPKLFKLMQSRPYYVTVKCDGTSGTFLFGASSLIETDDDDEAEMPSSTLNSALEDTPVEFIVCSRNQIRRKPDNISVCPYWYIANKYDLEEKLQQMPHLAIQGEICGPNVQNNLLGLKDLELFVFNIVDMREPGSRKLPFDEMVAMCKQLHLQTAPIEEIGDSFDYKSMKDVIKKAEGNYVKSKRQREGLVFRSKDQQISFKAINNKYLLKLG